MCTAVWDLFAVHKLCETIIIYINNNFIFGTILGEKKHTQQQHFQELSNRGYGQINIKYWLKQDEVL